MEDHNKKLRESIFIPLGFVGILWVIHFIQIAFGWDWGYYGILPRSTYGLKGIITAPLIHGDLRHLISNSIPLLMLTGVIIYFYRRVAFRSFIMIYILTGISVWLFARTVYHIGASGVVYGLVAFLFWNGIFRRSLQSIVLALIVTVMYSGMFMGVLPNQEGISWESHLYGAFTGVFASFFYKEELEVDEIVTDPFADEKDVLDSPYFFQRDVFDKTKAQREQERLEAIERARKAREEGLDSWTSSNSFDA